MTFLHSQHGVVTLRQALTVMSRGEVRARLRSGRWQRPHRGVLVTHNGPLSPEQETWVCLLAAPPGSALAGPTAAAIDGLRGFASAATWIAIPAAQRKLQRDGVLAIRTRHLGPEDVHPRRTPRRTRIERSVLDMGSRAAVPSAARAPVLAAVQQRVTTPHRLLGALTRLGHRVHHAVLLETIHDAGGGVHSLPEREFDRITRRRGLPPPTRQRAVRRPGGHYYLDSDWEEFDLSVEIHGLPHLEVCNWNSDLDRHNELTIDGRRLLQFTSYAVRHQAARVGEQVERGLRRGGWRP
ncbi:hypothetical protein H0B56_19425 [Haloechinothrix sp. YIM 98757]|uniref:Transcriptional regulator, AbiEi antitoxin, Type IV TA system n=1 Tax=Haloechinothrix aidingensis TaxID=2752311 RepID=A0A838AET4_9PSEU|nr:hypothetical protein [Haloechinothrix aidingensis]MBA0127721.1 hypothetical protein [Haloechinothrix aidingensis]